MKLLFCAKCEEIQKLWFEYKECKCGQCGGQYTDNLNAKIWGNPETTFVLGFANRSFIQALRDQMIIGDSEIKMNYAGEVTTKGRDFTAFVIPNAARSVKRFLTKDEYEKA